MRYACSYKNTSVTNNDGLKIRLMFRQLCNHLSLMVMTLGGHTHAQDMIQMVSFTMYLCNITIHSESLGPTSISGRTPHWLASHTG